MPLNIIITGANGGIGKALLKRFARDDNYIVVASRKVEKYAAIKEALNYDKILALPLDLGSFASIHAFAKALKDNDLRPDILINNAGIIAKHFSLTAEQFETNVGVNFCGTYLLTTLVAPLMSGKSANIVNVTSCTRGMSKINHDFFVAKQQCYNKFFVYAKAKRAVYWTTKYLADTLRSDGIRVNAVDPGVVNTNMLTMDAWFDRLTNILFRPFTKSADKATIPYLNAIGSDKTGYVFTGNKSHPIDLHKHHDMAQWLFSQLTPQIIDKYKATPKV